LPVHFARLHEEDFFENKYTAEFIGAHRLYEYDPVTGEKGDRVLPMYFDTN